MSFTTTNCGNLRDESPMARLRGMKNQHRLASSSLAIAATTAAAGSGSPSPTTTTCVLQGPTPVASNTAGNTSKSIGNEANSGYIFHQQRHHHHVQAKAMPSSSLQAALAGIQRKEQPAEEVEAESRECDDQHTTTVRHSTWLNDDMRQESLDAQADDEEEERDGISASSATSVDNDDIATANSKEGSEGESKGPSGADRGGWHSRRASIGSGLFGTAIPSHDEEETFATTDDDATKAAKETYEEYNDDDDDGDDTTKVGDEDLTLTNPASLEGTLSGGTVSQYMYGEEEDAIREDADASDGDDDDNDGDESTTIGVIETNVVSRSTNTNTTTAASTMKNRVRLETDESGSLLRPRHPRQGRRGSGHRHGRNHVTFLSEAEIALSLTTSTSTLRSLTSTVESSHSSSSPAAVPWTNQSEGTSTLLGSLLPGNAGLPRGPINLFSSLESVILTKVDAIERSISRIVGLGGPDEIDGLEQLAAELDVLSDIMSADADDYDEYIVVVDQVTNCRGEGSTLEVLDSDTFDTTETTGTACATSAVAVDVQPDATNVGGVDKSADTSVDSTAALHTLPQDDTVPSEDPIHAAKGELEVLRAEIEALRKEMQRLEKVDIAPTSPKLTSDHSDNEGKAKADVDVELKKALTATGVDSVVDAEPNENCSEENPLTKLQSESGHVPFVNTVPAEDEPMPISTSNAHVVPVLSPTVVRDTTTISEADGTTADEFEEENGIEYSLSRLLVAMPSREEGEEEDEQVSFPPELLLSPRTENLMAEVAVDGNAAEANQAILPSSSLDNLPASTASEPGLEISLQSVKPGTPVVKTPLLLCDESGVWEEVQDAESCEDDDTSNANIDVENTETGKTRRRFSFKGPFTLRLKSKNMTFSPCSNSSQKVKCDGASVISNLTSPTNDIDGNVNKFNQKAALAEAKRLEAETRKVEASIRLEEARAAKATALAAAEARRLDAEAMRLKAQEQVSLERAAKNALHEEALAEKIKELRRIAEEKLQQKEAKAILKEEARQMKVHQQQERSREARRVKEMAAAEKAAARKIKADEIERKRIEALRKIAAASAEKEATRKAKAAEIERKRIEEYQANAVARARRIEAQQAWEIELKRRAVEKQAQKELARKMKHEEAERKRVKARLAKDIAATEKKAVANAKQEEIARKRMQEFQANQLATKRKMAAQKEWEEELERRAAEQTAKKKLAKETEEKIKIEIREAKKKEQRAREEVDKLRRKLKDKEKWAHKAKEAAQRNAKKQAANKQTLHDAKQSISKAAASASNVSRSMAARMANSTHAVGGLVADLAKCTVPGPSATVDHSQPFSETSAINTAACPSARAAEKAQQVNGKDEKKNVDLNVEQENNINDGLTVAIMRISRV